MNQWLHDEVLAEVCLPRPRRVTTGLDEAREAAIEH